MMRQLQHALRQFVQFCLISRRKGIAKNEHRRARGRVVDIRLILVATVLWVSTAFTLSYPHLLYMPVLVVVLLSACALLTRFFDLPLLLLVSAIVVLQIGVLQAKGELQDAHILQGAQGSVVRVEGIVTSSQRGAYGYELRLSMTRLEHAGVIHGVDGSVLLFASDAVAEGLEARATGELTVNGSYLMLKKATVWPKDNSHVSSPGLSPINQLRNVVSSEVNSRMGVDRAALVLGMTYGDDSGMTDQAQENFRTSGLTHLTAVSGANITLMFVLGYRGFQWFGVPRLGCIICGVLFICGYVLLVGAEPSALRALVMGLVGAIALIRGSGRFSLPFLATAMITCLLLVPEYSLNYGFALSVIATGSLVVLAPAVVHHLGTVIPRSWAEVVAIPLAASLWCSPVMLLMTEELQTYTVVANILAVPFVGPVTCLGLLIVLLTVLGIQQHPAMSLVVDVLCWCAGWCVQRLLDIAQVISSLPASSLHLSSQPFVVAVSIACVVGISAALVVADTRISAQVYTHVRSSHG